MSTNTHISYLDSIRGLAALSVINEHFVIGYGLPCQTAFCRQILDYSPLHFWWDGEAAVSMFFVLSGLVLSLKYFREGHQPNLQQFGLVNYVVGRMFRIWLPYLLMVVISAGLYLYITNSAFPLTKLVADDWLSGMWHKHPLTNPDMLRETFLLQLPSTIVLLPQAWTLGIELLLSLFLPLGLLLAERGSAWLIFFTVAAVSLLGVSPFLLHFLLGLLLARYYRVISNYLSIHTTQRRFILICGLLFYTLGDILPGQLNDTPLWLSTGLGAGLILMFVFGSINGQKWLSHPLLRQIGKVSYSAYLMHMAILICVVPHFLKTLEMFSSNQLVLWFAGWAMTLASVQLLSLLSYHYLEIPSISLGRRFMGLFQARRVNKLTVKDYSEQQTVM